MVEKESVPNDVAGPAPSGSAPTDVPAQLSSTKTRAAGTLRSSRLSKRNRGARRLARVWRLDCGAALAGGMIRLARCLETKWRATEGLSQVRRIKAGVNFKSMESTS